MGEVIFSALTRNQHLDPSSWNTALIPEEAESALEATHYFTEDSSSEGESLLRHLAQPALRLQPPCRKPAVHCGLREHASLGCSLGGPCHTSGPGWPCRCSHPLFLLHLSPWTWAFPSALCASSAVPSSISSGLRSGSFPALGGTRSVPGGQGRPLCL